MTKVKTAFYGVPDGEVFPVMLDVGDEIHGDLAKAALDEGYATDLDGGEVAEIEPLEVQPLAVKHVGGGRYGVFNGDERLTDQPLSKDDAELELARLSAASATNDA